MMKPIFVCRFAVVSLVGMLAATPVARADEGWGSVKGRIVLDAPKAPARVQVNVDKDQAHCLGKGPLFSEELVVNPDNLGVRWTFVWLATEPGAPPLKIHPNLQQVKNKNVEIDQPCCQFVPHALGMRSGQDLIAKNSSPIAHNVHWTGHPLKNPGGNQIIPAGQSLTINGLNPDRFPVKVNCDIHGWMVAYVRVFDHPYFAVTDENGKFDIKQAPAGNYRLVIWQDNGWGPGGKDGEPITIKAGEATDKGDVKFKPPQ
jgi:hypothetical protein